MTAPDRAPAVRIAARVLAPRGVGSHSDDSCARAVVAALDAAALLRRPDEAAYVAALEAVAEAADGVYRALEGPDAPQLSHRAVAAFYVLRRALDAARSARTLDSSTDPIMGLS